MNDFEHRSTDKNIKVIGLYNPCMKGKYISPNSYSIPGLSDSWNSENGIVHSRPEFRYCKGKEKRNEKSRIIVYYSRLFG